MNDRSPVTVSIDLQRIRQNTQGILALAGKPIIAVVKADAYGLGASQIAGAIGDLVEAFYVFDAREAIAARLWQITGRRTIALQCQGENPDEFISRHIHPVVWTVARAQALRLAKPVLCIDTGQQRFACDPADAASVRDAGDCREIMTHAVTPGQVQRFRNTIAELKSQSLFLHAAGSALLGESQAWFDAVRPGLALYRGAARVSARLVEARDSTGPAGYTGFTVNRFGVILAGYSGGIRVGPCSINGRLARVLEVGMQSSFVQLDPSDRIGDEVVLLGNEPGVDGASVARAWGSSQQEVLVRLTGLGERKYA